MIISALPKNNDKKQSSEWQVSLLADQDYSFGTSKILKQLCYFTALNCSKNINLTKSEIN